MNELVVDRERSLLTIQDEAAGVAATYPAVIIVCPLDDETDDDCDWSRSLGGDDGDGFFIPSENGVIFGVSLRDNGTMQLDAMTSVCSLSGAPGDQTMLPIGVRIEDGKIVRPHPQFIKSPFPWATWWGCEPWWVIEQIARLSAFEVGETDGPRVALRALHNPPQRCGACRSCVSWEKHHAQ